MLRRDEAVAVDEVVLAAEEAATAYEDGAHILQGDKSGDAELVRLFFRLAQARHDIARELAASVARMGDVASAPDPDRETAHTAVRHIKAHLVSSGPLALIRERTRGEDRLAARIAEAENRAGDEARATLARAAASVKDAQRALGDARARLEP